MANRAPLKRKNRGIIYELLVIGSLDPFPLKCIKSKEKHGFGGSGWVDASNGIISVFVFLFFVSQCFAVSPNGEMANQSAYKYGQVC